MSKKKKSYTGAKIGLGTVLGGAIILEGIKGFLFGSPPKTWRKTIVYGGLTTYFLGNLYSDQIGKVYNDFWEHQSTMQAQKLERVLTQRDSLQVRSNWLENEKGVMAARADTLEKMIENLNELKAEETENLRDRLDTYESVLESRTRELNQERTNANRLRQEVQEANNSALRIQESNESNTQRYNSQQQSSSVPNISEEVNWYSARRDDTFESIGRKYLGSENKGRLIERLNPGVDEIINGTPILLPNDLISLNNVNQSKLPTRTLEIFSHTTFSAIAKKICTSNMFNYTSTRILEGYNLDRNNFRDPIRGNRQLYYLPEEC